MNSDWVIWQLVDSTFPAGGFAHSGGLESLVKWGDVDSPDCLFDFLKANLTQAVYSLVPFVTATHREPVRVKQADAACDALLTNHVANRASRAQGRAFLASTASIFRLNQCREMQGELSADGLAGHFAPIFGVVSSALGVELKDSVLVFVRNILRDLISAAVRLNVVGPLQGQSIQTQLAPFVQRLTERTTIHKLEDATQTSPIIEVFQGTHDRLYSRLFQS